MLFGSVPLGERSAGYSYPHLSIGWAHKCRRAVHRAFAAARNPP